MKKNNLSLAFVRNEYRSLWLMSATIFYFFDGFGLVL